MNQSKSTDIKPGQVWAWRDDTFANGEPGHTFRIDSESHSPGHWNYAYVGACARFYGPSGHRHVASAEIINHAASLVTDATPAPLDPSQKARVEIADWDDFQEFDVVVQMPGIDGGPFVVERAQAAPEPEPVWEPGTVALISTGSEPDVMASRLRGGNELAGWRSLSGYMHWTDEQINSVRPLVVIDPAAVDVEALTAAAWDAQDQALLEVGLPEAEAVTRAVLARLGIEAS